jgi:hypothetical protein
MGHFGRDGAGPVARQTIYARADDEMGAEVPGEAEQLVDVALAVADVDAASRVAEETHRPPEAVEPADALLSLDRHAGGVDHPLERRRSPELRPRPDFHGCHPERHAVLGDGEAGVQEEAAKRVVPPPTLRVAAAVDALGDADRGRGDAPVGELGRVLEEQDHAAARPEPLGRRREMAAEDVGLAHPPVGEEAVRRLRPGPVSAGLGYGRPDTRCELPEQAREAAV